VKTKNDQPKVLYIAQGANAHEVWRPVLKDYNFSVCDAPDRIEGIRISESEDVDLIIAKQGFYTQMEVGNSFPADQCMCPRTLKC